MEETLKDFLAETNEGLLAVEQQMLQLEKDPKNLDLVDDIFRVLHTIKGNCGVLGLNRLQQIAHYSENIFGKARDGALDLDEDTLSILFEAIDRIKSIVENLSNGDSEGSDEIDEILKLRLDTCARTQKSIASTFVAPKEQGPELNIAPEVTEIVPINDSVIEEVVNVERQLEFSELVNDFEIVSTTIYNSQDLPENIAEPVVEEVLEEKQEALEDLPILEIQNNSNKANSVRVSVSILDQLVDCASEMILLRSQLMQIGKDLNDDALNNLLSDLNSVISQLQESVLKTRIQPIETIWLNIPRQVRDLCKELGKKINVEMIGQDTEIDRQVLDVVKDPLMHMINNAIDHGIETSAERVQANKPEEGTLTLKAYNESGHLLIEVADDGKGIDTKKMRELIIKKELLSQTEAESIDEAQLINFIFNPGFSTAQSVTKSSGRGVGMDIVKANVEKIGGTISVESKPGIETRFIIKIPSTLAIAPAVIVACGNLHFAIPQHVITKIIRINEKYGNTIEYVNQSPVLRFNNELLPLVISNDLFEEPKISNEQIVVCLTINNFRFGLSVDKVFDIQELLVKPLSRILSNIKFFSGSAVLSNGSVALVLDVNALALSVFGNINLMDHKIINLKDEQISEQPNDLLIFRVAQLVQAVPLNMVKHIAEINTSAVSKVGEQYIYSAQNLVMPIILSKGMPSTDFTESAVLPMFVMSDGKRQVGIIVSEVLDIVADNLQQDRLLETIDINYYLNTAYPNWFGGING
jgi:two-component system chemotaxis sensor kinase CheA